MGRIAVLGCGIMGLKIAGNFAYCGHIVKMFDTDRKQLDMAYERIHRDGVQLYRDGLIEGSTFAGQILVSHRLEDAVKDVQFIFECISENLELKQNLIEKIGQSGRSDVIICSNTLQLDLEEISANLRHKQNFLGVRFLFPVYYIREVELNLTQWTSAQTINALRKLLEPMDKVLFFRSSSKPLILNEQQQEDRRKFRFDALRSRNGMTADRDRFLPDLTSKSTNDDRNQDEHLQSENNRRGEIDMTKANVVCTICMDRTRDAVIRSCNHLVSCYKCARLLFDRQDPCPVCRQRIDDVIRVYI